MLNIFCQFRTRTRGRKSAKMKRWSAFLVILFTIELIAGQLNQAQCTYELTNTVYTCRLINQNIQNEGNLQQIGGSHLPIFGDNDVMTLTETNSVINVFPSLLINRFVNLNSVLLTGVQMKQFVSPIRNCANLSVIILNFNEIPTINSGNFANCNKIVYFSITNSGVENVHEGAFNGLTGLKFLSLSANNIATINMNIFAQLSQLEILELSDNKIMDLSHTTFQFMPLLSQLSLDGNQIASWNSSILASNQQLEIIRLNGNKIQNLDGNTFSGLPNLITLLIGNNIETIPMFVNPGELKNLSLSNNPIKEVSAISFQNLRTLEKLYLDFCQIENVNFEQDAGSFLQELRLLSLTNNRITNLKAYAFSMLATLETLYLSGNQIQRLNANTIRPIMQMRLLDVSGNRINRIERGLFDGANNLTFRATGNVCVSKDVTVLNSAQFDRDIVPVIITCLNFAIVTKVNTLLLILTASLAIFLQN